MKKTTILIALIISILSISFGIYKFKSPVPMQKRTRFLMDTYCTITVPGDKKVIPIIDAALDRMQELDTKLNVNTPGSQIYNFSFKNGTITDNEIVYLVKVALDICEKSEGAKDITLYPISKLWGFYSDSPHLPKKEEIAEALTHTGYKNILIKDGKVTKLREDITIDLGSIAKGYAVGEAAKILRKGGIKSAIIDGGGQIYTLGLLNGKPWKIGIKHPREDGYIGSLEVSDLSIATSGDYQRFFIKDGIRYHHIMNAKTGYPAQGVMCATIINPDPTMADDLTSAVFVLGKDKGLALAAKMPNTEAIIMTTDGKLYYSEGLKENMQRIKINKTKESK